MFYIKQSDNSKHSLTAVRKLFPNVSIPEGGDMLQYGFAHLVLTEPPVAQQGFEVIEGPIVNGATTWVQQPSTPAIPMDVTMRQARLALLGAGVLATADAAIAAMSGMEGHAAQIEWEYAQEIRRDSPLVFAMSNVLGLTEATIDQLFITASTL